MNRRSACVALLASLALLPSLLHAQSVRELPDFTERGQTILLYGASGAFGVAMTREALERGYNVVGVSRNPARFRWGHPRFFAAKGDLTDKASVRELLNIPGLDIIVSGAATGPSNTPQNVVVPVEETVQVIGAKHFRDVLLEMGEDHPRIFQVGGATTLTFKGEHAFDAFTKNPWIVGPMPAKGSATYPFFMGNYASLKVWQNSKGIRWTVVTPGYVFTMGPRRGVFRYADDEMVFSEKTGLSEISRADLSMAIVNEIVAQQYIGKRFTVSY